MTEYGHQRDWRCHADASTDYSDWIMQNSEYVRPLRAIAPLGTSYPQNMDLANWTLEGNKRVIERNVSGFPVVTHFEYYDGTAYAAGAAFSISAAKLTSSSTWAPRWSLSFVRHAPPPGQGMHVWLAVNMRAEEWSGVEWVAGACNVFFPLHHDEYDRPFLHFIFPEPPGDYDVLTVGDIVSLAPAPTGLGQGPQRETWLFEYEEDPDRYDGGHVLIRSPSLGGQWWHHHERTRRLNSGTLKLTVGGAVTAFNIASVRYTRAPMTAAPAKSKPLPEVEGSTWHQAASWGGITTPANNWTVTVEGHPIGLRPRVTFAIGEYGDEEARPILWFAHESHTAVVGDVEAGTETTEGEAKLVSLTWVWDQTYRGSRGQATFLPFDAEPFSAWRENGKVEIYLGWQSQAGGDYGDEVASAKIAEGYIMPGGLPKSLDGTSHSGRAILGPVSLGAFDLARLPQKTAYDLRQFGGMTLLEFGNAIAARLGLPPTKVDVDAAVVDQIIPLSEMPSVPSFAAQDGDSWDQLFSSIESACDVRIGFGKSDQGELFIDAGPPTYDPGTSVTAFTIQESPSDRATTVRRIDHEQSGEKFRNFLKAIVGPQGDRQEFYYSESLATRKAGIGDDWPRVMIDEDTDRAGGLGNIVQQFSEKHYAWQDEIEWIGPARRDLRPDDFVEIGTVSSIGLTSGHIYQITTHAILVDAQNWTTESVIRARLVYPEDAGPPEGAYGGLGMLNAAAFNAGGFNG